MSWPDPNRRFEPAEDAALRAELGELLGLEAPAAPSRREPTPELIHLAEELRKEAQRRRRTERRRPSWGLMAAAVIPLVAGMAAFGAWGAVQQRKAEALAEKAQQAERLERVAEAHRLALAKEREARVQMHQELVKAAARQGRKVPELVIPAEDPIRMPGGDQTLVKAPGR